MQQSPRWDHLTPLIELLAQHVLCLYEPLFKLDWADEGARAVGALHLQQPGGGYTTLALADDGWIYASDITIGEDALAIEGLFIPMLTSQAVAIIEGRAKAPTQRVVATLS